MRQKRVKTGFIIFFFSLVGSGISYGQEKKFQLIFFGGLTRTFQYGSQDDYISGGNDFPVTPAHSSPNIGLGIAYLLKEQIAIEFNGGVCFSSKVRREDPSDRDTVEISTFKHYPLVVNLLYVFPGRKIKPCFLIGLGIDKLSAKDKTYVSQYGFEVEILTPKRTVDPIINMGGGFCWFLDQTAGLRFDLRYAIIVSAPDNIHSLSLLRRVVLRL